jgi:hypothetical protein
MTTVRMNFSKVLIQHESVTMFLITILLDYEPHFWVVQNTDPNRNGVIDTERGYFNEDEAVNNILRELETQTRQC